MQFRLLVDTRKWEVRYPQAGSTSGWSDWTPLNRRQALQFIERGWSFETI